MTEKYIVNAFDMTLMADTTRNRAGVNNSLAFPDGFADTSWRKPWQSYAERQNDDRSSLLGYAS